MDLYDIGCYARMNVVILDLVRDVLCACCLVGMRVSGLKEKPYNTSTLTYQVVLGPMTKLDMDPGRSMGHLGIWGPSGTWTYNKVGHRLGAVHVARGRL